MIRVYAFFLFFLASTNLLAAANSEDPAEELSRELEQYNKQAEQALKRVEQVLGSQPVSPEQVSVFKKKVLELANDDRFLKSAEMLWKSENRNKMLFIQLGWFVLMVLLKAWRKSKASHWFMKILIGLFFRILTWVGIVYAIPAIVMGEPFFVFTGTLFKLFH